MWPLSSDVRPLNTHLAILVVAVCALGMRVYFAIADDLLLSVGHMAPLVVDALFVVAAIGLAFRRPIIGRAFWRVVFLVLGILTTVAFGILGPFFVFGAISGHAGGLSSLAPFGLGVAIHLVLMAGLYLYVYRAPGIWSVASSTMSADSGTMA